MVQKGNRGSARGRRQLQKDLSVLTLSQSGLTIPCENVEEQYLFICHTARIQPSETSGWLQASDWQGSSAVEDADIPVSAVSEPRPMPASFPRLSADLRGVLCGFPWRRSVGRSQHFAGADNGVWKYRRYLSCRLEAGAPFLSGLEPHSALSAHSHGRHWRVGSSSPASQIPHSKLPSHLVSSLFSLLLKSEAT